MRRGYYYQNWVWIILAMQEPTYIHIIKYYLLSCESFVYNVHHIINAGAGQGQTIKMLGCVNARFFFIISFDMHMTRFCCVFNFLLNQSNGNKLTICNNLNLQKKICLRRLHEFTFNGRARAIHASNFNSM